MSYKGKFLPKNPQKYAGNVNNIIWRSTWERQVMGQLDLNENVLLWASEELVIRYLNPIDKRVHRYFPDFVVKVKTRTNEIKTYVLEVKPDAQTRQPTRKRKTKKFLSEAITYEINKAKWLAAEEFCKDRGWIFKLVTEHDLGI